MLKPRGLLLLFLLVVTACTSTEERYEGAEQLAAQGRYEEAAGEYIRVLDSDPDFPGARDGLIETGTAAIDQFLGGARDYAEEGRFEDASRTLDRLDRLRQRAGTSRDNRPSASGARSRRHSGDL